jgi:Protein of unknown function (DUF1236)
MRKLALTGAALLGLAAITASPVLADDAGAAAAGGSAGAVTGATAGFFIGGPVGAVVGGVLGASVGAGVSTSAEDYARHHREASVTFNGHLRPGYRVRPSVHLYDIPSEPHYSYVYVNGDPVLVDNRNDTVVWVGND